MVSDGLHLYSAVSAVQKHYIRIWIVPHNRIAQIAAPRQWAKSDLHMPQGLEAFVGGLDMHA